jgi:hypothetical protein
MEQKILEVHQSLIDLHKKVDYIIQLILPKLSELQEAEVKHELFLDSQKEFNYNLDDTAPEDFNINIDSIINENKLI